MIVSTNHFSTLGILAIHDEEDVPDDDESEEEASTSVLQGQVPYEKSKFDFSLCYQYEIQDEPMFLMMKACINWCMKVLPNIVFLMNKLWATDRTMGIEPPNICSQ